MPPLSLPALPSGKPTAWEEAIYAFLVEKRSRSGSTRTVESYARMLWPFFRVTAPDQVRSADVLAYAHGIGASGRVPSSTTVGARIACVSSFYRFAIRMGLLTANPCDALERPRTVPSVARGYSADEVRRLLAVVPDTVRGRRDRAILLVLVLTGRRRAEVIGLGAGDLSLEGETVFYSYRGKGGKRGRPGAIDLTEPMDGSSSQRREHHRRVGEDRVPLGPRESGPTGWSVQRRSTERYRR